MEKKKLFAFYVWVLIWLVGLIILLVYTEKPPVALPPAAAEKTIEITIRKGSCLSEIAHDLGTSCEEIAKLNGINPNKIFPGQKIRVHPFNKTNIVKVSWYGPKFHGKPMANGKTYDMNDPTVAAHKWLPLGIPVILTRIDNGKNIKTTVQDRGPYVPGRTFDLSYGAAKLLDMVDEGVTTCKVEILN